MFNNYKNISDLQNIAAAKNQPLFILILDGIEDPHNFGAILRTAEAAGVHGVVIRKSRQVQVTDTVMRISTNAANLVPIARVANIAETISSLVDEGINAIGLEIDGKRLYNEVDFKVPTALVIGSEGKGMARLVKERCSEVVRIPMMGTINSLNASVATGIVLFEAVKQRL